MCEQYLASKETYGEILAQDDAWNSIERQILRVCISKKFNF